MKKVLAVLLFLSLLLSGCGNKKQEESVQADWLASDGSVHTVAVQSQAISNKNVSENKEGLIVNHLYIDDIALIEVYNSTENDHPLLFIFHEQGGKKEDMLQMSNHYAENGFFCVLMDLPGYGERKTTEPIESLEASVLATKDIDTVLDYYRLQPGVNVQQIALLGISMGGSAVYHYAAYGNRIPAAIIVACTSPDYTIIDDMGSVSNGVDGAPSWSENQFRVYAKQHNPIDQLEKLAVPSILSFNGLDDDAISPSGSMELEEKLRDMGKENMEFIFQEGISHEISPQFEERVLPFLQECFWES